MSVSTNDELEAIERSARMGAPAVAPAAGGRRRGSSMFSGAGAVMSYQQAMDGTGAAAPAPGLVSGSSSSNNTTDQDSNLLVDFPGKAPTSAPAPITESKKRQSVVLQPMPGLGDFMNSDSEDDDDDEDAALAAAAAAGRLPGKPVPGAPDTMGGPNHRPLVGGFAAAAYEAARAHHYASKNKRK